MTNSRAPKLVLLFALLLTCISCGGSGSSSAGDGIAVVEQAVVGPNPLIITIPADAKLDDCLLAANGTLEIKENIRLEGDSLGV